MKYLFFCCSLLLINEHVFAQKSNKEDSIQYSSKIIQDYRIEKLEKVYSNNYKLEGYRIQIYSGTKSKPAKQTRLQFTQQYKDIKAHESYQQPYFKVRVGDFKTKLEALKFQKEIILQFPDCYIVNDEIGLKK